MVGQAVGLRAGSSAAKELQEASRQALWGPWAVTASSAQPAALPLLRPPLPPPPTDCPPLPCPSASAAGEQRAQVKGIKERSLVNKARNEAKKEMEEAQSDQPLHFLRVDGRSATLVRNDAQFFAIQQNEGLVPWAARPDVLIDRYDVRSLLDIYVDPDPRCVGGQCGLAVQRRVPVWQCGCAQGGSACPCC